MERLRAPDTPLRASLHASLRTSRGILRALVGVLTALAAAWGASPHAAAAADRDLIEALGAGAVWRPFAGLSSLLASPFMLLPVGTRVLRAGLANALLAGVVGALAFEVARATARHVLARTSLVSAEDASAIRSRLVDAVCAAATLAAVLAPAVQGEARVAGTALAGAAIVIAALLVAITEVGSLAASALLLGLAASTGPFVLAATGVVLARCLRTADRGRDGYARAALAAAIGMAPLVFALLTRARDPGIVLDGGFFEALASGPRGARAALAFVRRETFTLVLLAAMVAVVVMARARSRVASLPILAVLALAGGALLLGEGASGRAGPLTLAGFVVLHALAAIGFAAVPLAIARAAVPFAPASAALVVVLEMALPVRTYDETALRAAAAPWTPVWADEAFADLAPGALVLVGHRPLAVRLAAARATGDLRGDLELLPLYAPRSREASRALARMPELAPLLRDALLGVAPEELSFSRLAQARPLALTFEPSWDRNVARHLVPAGLFARFDPEPRAASERRAALESLTPSRERLAKAAARFPDPALARTTAMLLRSQALAIATTGDREALSRALDDLRSFAPDDPVATQLVRRIVTTRGPIDVKDLRLEP